MKIRVLLIALALMLATSITACKKEEGPMEKFGKSVDESAEKMEDAAKDAAKKAEDAVENVKDGG